MFFVFSHFIDDAIEQYNFLLGGRLQTLLFFSALAKKEIKKEALPFRSKRYRL